MRRTALLVEPQATLK